MTAENPRAVVTSDAEVTKGTTYGFGAYLLWGLFPLYFHALIPAARGRSCRTASCGRWRCASWCSPSPAT